MSNKLFTVFIILFVLVAFVVLSIDRDDSPSERLSQVLPHMGGECPVPTVEVDASEFKKFEANEFVTFAVLELHGKDKEILFRQITSRRASIFKQMKEFDISEADIEQNSVDMRKEWSYDKGMRSLTGYVVSQSFAIKSSSRAIAAAVIASLSAELDVEIHYTSATLKNEAALQKEIIHAAGKKALEKAQNYAESVGGKVGKVLSVSSDGSNGGVVLGTRRAMMNKTLGMYDGSESAYLSSVADSVELSARVHLVAEFLQ